jgi:hypothetical protein
MSIVWLVPLYISQFIHRFIFECLKLMCLRHWFYAFGMIVIQFWFYGFTYQKQPKNNTVKPHILAAIIFDEFVKGSTLVAI